MEVDTAKNILAGKEDPTFQQAEVAKVDGVGSMVYWDGILLDEKEFFNHFGHTPVGLEDLVKIPTKRAEDGSVTESAYVFADPLCPYRRIRFYSTSETKHDQKTLPIQKHLRAKLAEETYEKQVAESLSGEGHVLKKQRLFKLPTLSATQGKVELLRQAEKTKKESELEKLRSWEARRNKTDRETLSGSDGESSGEDDDGQILNTVQVQGAAGGKSGSKGGQRKGSSKVKSSGAIGARRVASSGRSSVGKGSGASAAGSTVAGYQDLFDDIANEDGKSFAGSMASGRASPNAKVTRGGIPVDPSEAADFWKARLNITDILNGTKLGRERHQAQT